jgi:hypothetical protein
LALGDSFRARSSICNADGSERQSILCRKHHTGIEAKPWLGLNRADVVEAGIPVCVRDDEEERWLGKFRQRDKWSFCLTVAKMATRQERP